MRGEYPKAPSVGVSTPGSPPLARGIPDHHRRCRHPRRITPACAGNTNPPMITPMVSRDHPRLRGEYDGWVETIERGAGSPPLARGIRISQPCIRIRRGITPACAGNTISHGWKTLYGGDHPRLRGEYFGAFPAAIANAGSPPLARGIPFPDRFSELLQGITPACAGNTFSDSARPRVTRDHPRLRGEYTYALYSIFAYWGSPPLARGIRFRHYTSSDSFGITPACAGNTK